ncbi:MAG: TonB-dependent receptor plug domain-containing protein, partial [Gemmatimonadetes bacterium]|nr:TonB-dependent receptor plug domain-containing protein [Gemmatimonadota bacterium]
MQLSRLRRRIGAALTLCVALLAGTGARAQQTPYTVQGTVVDAAARPLAGVAVTLGNTQTRTVTGTNGQFTLVARVQPGTYTLQFSSLGRGEVSRQVTLGADRGVQVGAVTLQETAVQLEGIVVTGTGAPVERRQVGNTVSTVSGEAINQSPAATSVDRALQGKVTGAVISQNSGAPGGGTTIRLRGTSSILGGADPLIVIDGVIVDNNSDALIALGSNATRQGSAVSNRLSDIAPGDIERVEVLKGAAAAALYGSRANNGVIQIFTKRGRQGTPQVSFQSEATQGVRPREFPVLMAPVASPGDVAFLGRKLGDTITRFDSQNLLFRTAYSTNNQLSLSGGSEGTSYYLSGSWIDEQGIVRTTGHDKRNVRLKLTQRLSDALEVTGSGSYVQSRTRYQPEGEQTQGALTSVLFTPTGFNPAFDPALGRYPYSPIVVANPLQVLQDLRAEVNVDRIIGSVQAAFTPFTNFSLNYLFGLDNSRESDLYLQPPYSTGPSFTGSISNPVRSIRKYNSDLTANYELPLRSGVQLTSTGGLRYTADNSNVVRSGAENLPPGQETVGGATQFASQSIVELRTFGGFIQERLALSDQLFLTGGLNMEASSAFG